MSVQTLEERMANLGRANEIRIARAELKAELKEGVRTLAEVLRADEDFIQTMKLFDLLKAPPGMGKVKANRALIGCRISGGAPVQNVTLSRREELIAWLAAHSKTAFIEREAFPVVDGGYR